MELLFIGEELKKKATASIVALSETETGHAGFVWLQQTLGRHRQLAVLGEGLSPHLLALSRLVKSRTRTRTPIQRQSHCHATRPSSSIQSKQIKNRSHTFLPRRTAACGLTRGCACVHHSPQVQCMPNIYITYMLRRNSMHNAAIVYSSCRKQFCHKCM